MVGMRRPALLALALGSVLLATAAPARADGTYFTLGMGPGEITDQLGQYSRESFGAKIGVGHRLGHLAFEGYVAPADGMGPVSVEMVRLGVDAKYILPVNEHLQVYVRGGLSKMSATLSGNNDGLDSYTDYTGRGLGGGAGVQLRGKVRALGFVYWPLFFVPVGPKVNAALFIDHGVDFYRLHKDVGVDDTIDARLTQLTIGFNVGADF